MQDFTDEQMIAILPVAKAALIAGNRVELLAVKGGIQVTEIRRKVLFRPEKPVDKGKK